MRDLFIGLEGNKSIVYEIKPQVQQVSMRMGVLKEFGGDLKNQYDSCRFDSYSHSRYARHKCRKDWRISVKSLDRKVMNRHIARLNREADRMDNLSRLPIVANLFNLEDWSD